MRITGSDYHDLASPEHPRLSPSGESVAFVRKRPVDDESYESTVFVGPADGSEPPTRFTIAGDLDSAPEWSPSGDRIAFVSDRNDKVPQLWVLPVDGGEARKVTEVVGGVANPTWSPDGDRIAFVQRVTAEEREAGHDREQGADYEREQPDPRVINRLVYRAHGEYFDGVRSHVYTVDMAEDAVKRVTEGEYDFEHPEWGDPETLYYSVRRTGVPDDTLVHDVVAHDLPTHAETTVVQTTGWLPAFSATADGRVAYRYSRNEEPGPAMYSTQIKVHNRETGETVTPTAGFERRVYRGSKPQWGPEGDLYFLAPDEGAVKLARVAPEEAATVEVVLGGDDRHVDALDVTDRGAAFVQSEWNHPGDVFVTDFSGAPTRVSRLNEAYLDDHKIVRPEPVSFRAEGGPEIEGWVLTPPDFDPGETYPMVVEIHGGPTIMWTTSGTMWHEFQTLAAAGYVVFWCNPRGSTGYGEEFATAIGEDWGALDFADIMAGVDEVAARDYVDEDCLFVTGGSYGGFMTAWTIGHTDRFRAAVAQRGVYDQVAQFGATDCYHSNEWQLGMPWEDPESYWEASPIAYADDVDTPTLIIHSENDFRVPVHNADVFYRFLKKTGVETELVRYPRETHELSRAGEPGHVVDRFERILAWFGDHGGVPTGEDGDPDR
jgi:dipeptidyl aminopeptidase/acylaminoacyl peptidase